MKIELNKQGERRSSRSPAAAFRKWVLIGAIIGALLVGLAGALVLGIAMIGGGLVGAVVGTVFGVYKAAVAAIRRD